MRLKSQLVRDLLLLRGALCPQLRMYNPATHGFYFMHIPKTGGTTITSMLDAMLVDHNVFPYKVWNDLIEQQPLLFTDTTKSILADYRYVRGHFGYTLDAEMRIPFYRFTILRNPLARTFSQYKHMLRDMEHNNWATADQIDINTDPLRLFVSREGRQVFGNVIQKTLCSQFNFRASVSDHMRKGDAVNYNLLSLREFTRTSGFRYLPAAIRHLFRLDLVGILELLPESMALVSIATHNRIPPLSSYDLRMMSFNDHIEDEVKLEPALKHSINKTILCDRIIYNVTEYRFRGLYARTVNGLVGTHYKRGDVKNPAIRLLMYAQLSEYINQ